MTLADHLALAQRRDAVRTAKLVLETLADVPLVVVGGWAVYAHGSAIPSVDMDVWIPSPAYPEVQQVFLEQHEIQIDTREAREALNFDFEFLDAPNHLFDRPESYMRSELETQTMRLLGVEAKVLTGPDLFFSKAKAFHDRSQQWAVRTDPERLASLAIRSPDDAWFVQGRSPGYWLRKAGKDWLDLQFLRGEGYRMGGPPGLRPIMEAALLDPPRPIVAWSERSRS